MRTLTNAQLTEKFCTLRSLAKEKALDAADLLEDAMEILPELFRDGDILTWEHGDQVWIRVLRAPDFARNFVFVEWDVDELQGTNLSNLVADLRPIVIGNIKDP